MHKTVLILGDSHARHFASTPNGQLFHNIDFDIIAVGIGMASARGLANEKNTTNSHARIQDNFAKLKQRPNVVCFAFGQVDVEYVYLYRQCVLGIKESFKEFVEETLNRYFLGIEKLTTQGDNVIIKGINYPVISNQELAIQNAVVQILRSDSRFSRVEIFRYAKRFQQAMPSYTQRLRRAQFFNRHLRRRCFLCGFKYFDVMGETIDPERKVIRPEYMPRRSLDHHMADCVTTERLYLTKLNAVMDYHFY